MGRTVDPPKDPKALQNLIGGGSNAPDEKDPRAASDKGKQPGQVKPLPSGRMGDPCQVKGCKGKLTDLSRAHLAKKDHQKGRTLITLYCNTCQKVQAQADIPDLE